MARVKHSISTRKRKHRVLKAAKGQWGDRSRRYRLAKETIARGLRFATRDRKVKKREIRSLWITRINAACRELGVTYSDLINALKKAKIVLDRKVLAEIALSDPATFKKIIEIAKV